MEKAICICGATQSTKLYKLQKDKKTYTIVKCKNCQMIYMNPRPSAKELIGLYKKNYYYDDTFLDTKNYLKALLLYQETSEFLKRKKILDVGCSKGFLLEVLKNHKFIPYGIEPSQDAINFAKKNFGIKVQKGYFNLARFHNKFDTITAIDVIEHVTNPLKTLKKMHELLEPHGVVLIETPNISSLYAKINGKRWMGFDVPFHLYFFTPRHLKKLLEEAGFHNVQISSSHFNLLSREGFLRSKGFGTFNLIRLLLRFVGKDPDAVALAIDRKLIKNKQQSNKFVKRKLNLLDKTEIFFNKPLNTFFAKQFYLGDAVRAIATK